MLFERFIKPNFFQQEPDTARVDEALGQTLPEALTYLEGRLDDGADSFGTRFGMFFGYMMKANCVGTKPTTVDTASKASNGV